jgi:hypothetical protein
LNEDALKLTQALFKFIHSLFDCRCIRRHTDLRYQKVQGSAPWRN